MARRRYYRRYTRVVAPKKKWATNMYTGALVSAVAAGATDYDSYSLVVNSTQVAVPTPVVVKCGNFKVQGDCYVFSQNSSTPIPAVTRIIVYVMYLPESVLSVSLPTVIHDHPEWILAWKAVDVNPGSATSNSNSFSFSSRLKRNLNSGDTVSIVAVAHNGSTAAVNMTVNFAAQWWTCSN